KSPARAARGGGPERDRAGGGRGHLRRRAPAGARRPWPPGAGRVGRARARRRAAHAPLVAERRGRGGRRHLLSAGRAAARARRRLRGHRLGRRRLPDGRGRPGNGSEPPCRPAAAGEGAHRGGDRALRGQRAIRALTYLVGGGTWDAALVRREMRRDACALWITPLGAALAIWRTAGASSCLVLSGSPAAAGSRSLRTQVRSVDFMLALLMLCLR